MIKSIFVEFNQDFKHYRLLSKVGANHLIISAQFLTPKKWKIVKECHTKLGVSVDSFGRDGCPASKESLKKLKSKKQKAKPKK